MDMSDDDQQQTLVIEIILDEASHGHEILQVSASTEEAATVGTHFDDGWSAEEEQVVVNYDDDGYPLELPGGEENYDAAYIDEDWDAPEETYSVKCDQCNREYPSLEKLRRHLRNHQERTHGCTYCARKFLYRKDRITHERTHTGERPFACHVCNKSFVQKCTLDTHLIQHYKRLKDEVCDQCGKAYFHKKSLALHVKEKHSTATKTRYCIYCGKGFLAYTKYIYHVGKCRAEHENGGTPSQIKKRRCYIKAEKPAGQE